MPEKAKELLSKLRGMEKEVGEYREQGKLATLKRLESKKKGKKKGAR